MLALMPGQKTKFTQDEARDLFRVALGGSAAGAGWVPPEPAVLAPFFPGYEIESLIARGGMGAVYRARQVSLNRTVAIKLLPFDLGVQEDFANRFRHEAEALARLNHPHIVAVHDFGQADDGHHFMVMEFVEGGDLAAHLREHGPLPPPEALRIVREVCAALHYAHEHGVVHRDVKPSNVLMDAATGRAKVSDFGIAKITRQKTEDGRQLTGLVGTPDYIAPEQLAQKANVDQRADLYSVGVMLYELLTGEIPRGVFRPVSALVPAARGLDAVLTRALQSDPTRRYDSALALSAELVLVPRRRRLDKWLALAAVLGVGFGAVKWARPKPTTAAVFENSLGLRFVPTGTNGVLFCTTEVRVRDFEGFWRATDRERRTGQFLPNVYFNFDGTDQGWLTRPASWREPGYAQTPEHPVVAVLHAEAVSFCEWLTDHERTSGRITPTERYRLPTHGEWNVAAGIAADAHDPSGSYPWGGAFPPPADAGNFASEELHEDAEYTRRPIIAGRRDAHRYTAPVGSYAANAYGLFDMAGNASEWAQGTGDDRPLMRGSSWWDSRSLALDSGYRVPLQKELRSFVIGFRIVLERPAAR